ncbi:MAG: tetratricopeptide repeat protein, partial [Deltaproteobacteria bacterium]|nr:tetratricopeptide repeat protein [Deltaproteobacteria bacterium]
MRRPSHASSVPMPAAVSHVSHLVIAACLAWLVGSSTLAQAQTDPLAQAEAALARSDYAPAEAGFRASGEGARARLGLARTLLETGRYDEAGRLAHEVAARARDAERVAAITLEGEAHLRRGRLDEATQTLQSIATDPTAHRARVFLGRALLRRGRATEARTVLMQLVRAYNDEVITERDAEGLAYVGMAAAMLGAAHDANDAFQQASRADARRPETQLEWADLYLSHYDAGHAEECLRDAIAVTPHSARVHVLAARIALAQGFDFDRARTELDAAFAVDPAMPAIHALRASIALRSLSVPEADAHVDLALATDPADLEALAMRATIRFLAEDTRGFERAVRAALAIDPTYSELYTVVAEHADWEHRYPDIVRLADEALRIDPRDARAMATRGMNLLRLGQEDEGITQLRAAFRRDRFNVRVFNTLNLWDDVITPHYEWVEGRSLRFRFHHDERPVLEPIVVPHLTDAFSDMRRRYGFTPRGPVHIEMFASNQHFSVRTEGLPNLGVQGVCFGQVLTALSPRAGEFDWAQITTHELAHVFHIQLSQNRVPRWFTEGLAEHETVMARTEWRRENDPQLLRALDAPSVERGGLPPLSRMNEAFTHARSAEGVMTAYYASSRLVAYLADRFGFAVFPRMLRAWGQGRTSAEVIQSVLRVSIDDLDRDWRAAERVRLGRYVGQFDVDFASLPEASVVQAEAAARPTDPVAQARLGMALFAAGRVQESQAALRDALRLDAHEATARLLLAEIALGTNDAAGALGHIDDLLAHGHDSAHVATLEARAALATEARPRAIAA